MGSGSSTERPPTVVYAESIPVESMPIDETTIPNWLPSSEEPEIIEEPKVSVPKFGEYDPDSEFLLCENSDPVFLKENDFSGTKIPVKILLFYHRLVWFPLTRSSNVPTSIREVIHENLLLRSENGLDIAPSCGIGVYDGELKVLMQGIEKVFIFEDLKEIAVFKEKLDLIQKSTLFFSGYKKISEQDCTALVDKILLSYEENNLRIFFFLSHLNDGRLFREAAYRVISAYFGSLQSRGENRSYAVDDLYTLLFNFTEDPIYFLFFTLFAFENGILEDFRYSFSNKNYYESELLEKFQEYILENIKAPNYTINRKFLFCLFDYPASHYESWSLMEPEIQTWIKRLMNQRKEGSSLLKTKRLNWEYLQQYLSREYFLPIEFIDSLKSQKPEDYFYRALQSLTTEHFRVDIDSRSLQSLFYNVNMSEEEEFQRLLHLFRKKDAFTNDTLQWHADFSRNNSRRSFVYLINGITYDFIPSSGEVQFSQTVELVPDLVKIVADNLKEIFDNEPRALQDTTVLGMVKFILRFESIVHDSSFLTLHSTYLISQNYDILEETKDLLNGIAAQLSSDVARCANRFFDESRKPGEKRGGGGGREENGYLKNESSFMKRLTSDEACALPWEIQQYENISFFEHLLYGIFVVGISLGGTDPDERVHFLDMIFKNAEPRFFEFYFTSKKKLRKMIFSYLVDQTPPLLLSTLNSQVSLARLEVLPLSRYEHFKSSVLKACVLSTDSLRETFRNKLFGLGLYMNDFDYLHVHLQSINDAAKFDGELEGILREMTDHASHRPAQEYVDAQFTLKELLECAIYASQATKILHSSPSGQRKLREVIPKYLDSFPIASWLSFFKALETIAFFIKYLDRENIDKAYAAFHGLNEGNNSLKSFLKSVKEAYPQPLVQSNQLSFTDENSVKNMIQRLLSDKSVSRISEMPLIKQIAAYWIEDRKKLLGICMPPRNTQVITLLVIIQWMKAVREKKDHHKSLLAQIGTGEGKSLVIAMIAIVLAKTSKKVHIMVNNLSLLQRDYLSFKSIYDKFGLTSAAADYNLADFENNIVYCRRGDIEWYYRESIQSGKKPFKDTVLIVDEVDSLIIDESTEQSFVRQDIDYSDFVGECFSALRRSGSSASPPSSKHPKIWQEAKDAFSIASSKDEGFGVPDGYTYKDGSYYMNDSRGRLELNTYSLWLEYVRFSKLPAYSPLYQSTFYLQSLIYMLNQYEVIIGLSGSLGSSGEKEFLAETYNAWFFNVPPFLDTCNDAKKPRPTLIDNCVYCYDSDAEQYARIMELATQIHMKVPVLIIAANARIVQEIEAVLPVEETSKQVFLEFSQSGKVNWENIIKLATRPLDDGPGYRITITDYWGGRGHDYRISDEAVNTLGGLAVILTTVPESEREWIQWKGRTARNDNNGQYAVILNKSAPEFEDMEASVFGEHEISGDRYNGALIHSLLMKGDEKLKSKLETQKKGRARGIAINKLCDDFYTKYPKESIWPADEYSKALRDFLEERGSATDEAIARFRQMYL